MDKDEHYEDCELCGERFVGEEAIASYLRNVDTPGGGVIICTKCLSKDHGERTIVIEVRLVVSVRVTAKKNLDTGEVDITGVLGFQGLPTPREIEESMDNDDFIALDKAYEEQTT